MSTAVALRSRFPARVSGALDEVCRRLGDQILVFVFGSHASARATARSDFDVGFVSRTPLPFRQLALIRDRAAELAWPYRIEIVDFSRAPKEFREVALRTVVVVQGDATDLNRLRQA